MQENIPKTPYKRHNRVCASYEMVRTFHVKIIDHMHIRWCSLTVTISATVVCRTPMFLMNHVSNPTLYCKDQLSYPLRRPPSARASKATGKLGAKPNNIMLSAVPASPVNKTGFRPILSLNLPQTTPDENSANANAEVTIPAYIDTSASVFAILKSFTMK